MAPQNRSRKRVEAASVRRGMDADAERHRPDCPPARTAAMDSTSCAMGQSPPCMSVTTGAADDHARVSHSRRRRAQLGRVEVVDEVGLRPPPPWPGASILHLEREAHVRRQGAVEYVEDRGVAEVARPVAHVEAVPDAGGAARSPRWHRRRARRLVAREHPALRLRPHQAR